MRLGQSALEYLLIVGLALVMIVPGAILFYQYSLGSGDELMRSKIDLIGNIVVDSVEKVYYIGENSWETVKVDVPNNVKSIYVLGNSEFVIEFNTRTGESEAVFYTDINITTPPAYQVGSKGYISNNSHTGLNLIKITSFGSYVLINESR